MSTLKIVDLGDAAVETKAGLPPESDGTGELGMFTI
jgi:hypothetical protein